MISEKINEEIKKLEGPIVVFRAGGFIGANLFNTIFKEDYAEKIVLEKLT